MRTAEMGPRISSRGASRSTSGISMRISAPTKDTQSFRSIKTGAELKLGGFTPAPLGKAETPARSFRFETTVPFVAPTMDIAPVLDKKPFDTKVKIVLPKVHFEFPATKKAVFETALPTPKTEQNPIEPIRFPIVRPIQEKAIPVVQKMEQKQIQKIQTELQQMIQQPTETPKPTVQKPQEIKPEPLKLVTETIRLVKKLSNDKKESVIVQTQEQIVPKSEKAQTQPLTKEKPQPVQIFYRVPENRKEKKDDKPEKMQFIVDENAKLAREMMIIGGAIRLGLNVSEKHADFQYSGDDLNLPVVVPENAISGASQKFGTEDGTWAEWVQKVKKIGQTNLWNLINSAFEAMITPVDIKPKEQVKGQKQPPQTAIQLALGMLTGENIYD
ncbi:MAG TPA: hypothetical protein VE090_00530 [Methylomirabilota bacterium]|nr:hypothetical protein [Methylomirabilota bacterium]